MTNKGLDSIDKIYIRLAKLREYLGYLRKLGNVTQDELEKEYQKRAVAERYLELATQACIDIAELLIIDLRLPVPSTGREAIEQLGNGKILDLEFAKEFAKIAGFRNILAHDYVKINYKIVAESINSKLGDFDTFAKQIASYLT